MSYRVRYTMHDGRTGLWDHDYATREEAQRAIDDRLSDTGFAYTVEVTDAAPAPKPTSTTERLVGLLRDRHARGLAKYGTTLDRGDLTPEQWAQHAIEEMLDGAAYLMRLRDTMTKSLASMEAIRMLKVDNRDLRDRLAVAQRQRDEAVAALDKEQRP